MIKGSIKGLKKMMAQLDRAQSEILSGQVKAVQLSTLRLHELAVQSIQEIHGGKPQVRYNPKRVVVASNPGDPPNSDTGRLVQSIKFDFQKSGQIGRVGSNLKYAAYLEFGTENMAPRPWLSTAVEAVNKEVPQIFEEQINDAIKKVVK